MGKGRMLRASALLAMVVLLGTMSAAEGGPDLPPVALEAFLTAAAPTGQAQQGSPVSKDDKTGTNPVNFQNTMVLWNEYRDLPGDHYFNQAVFEYRQPLQDRGAELRLRVPMVASDLSGDTEFGIGDIALRYLRSLKLTRKYAWAAGLETFFDTAGDDALGTGKYQLAPVVYYVMFLGPGRLIAPGYQHNFSIGGDDDRADINSGALDLYCLQMAKGGKSWVMLDPGLIINYEDDNSVSGYLKVVLGASIGGGASTYLKPAIGIGGDRSMDWSLEFGFKRIW
jgi:hypothetical protein